jgi:hypothetical protein
MDGNANSLSSDKCTNHLKSLKSVDKIQCVREYNDNEKQIGNYLITIESYPMQPHFNNIIHHMGNPKIDFFGCNTTHIDSELGSLPNCYIEDVISENIPAYLECGGHGVCDKVKGNCDCARGFNGLACDDTRDDAVCI